MRLPFAEEIAALRAEIGEVQPRAVLFAETRTQRFSLDVVQAQLDQGLSDPGKLPGTLEIRHAAATFSALAEVPTLYELSTTITQRMHARRTQLDLVMAHLEPAVDRLTALNEQMHILTHRQADASQAAEFDEAKALRESLRAQQQNLLNQIAPLQQQRAMVFPLRNTLESYVPRLEQSLITAVRSDDPDGRFARRVATMAARHRSSLLAISEQMGLTLSLPIEPALPDTMHPRHRPRLRSEAQAILEWMRTLDDALVSHGATLFDSLDRVQTELAQVEAAIQAITG